MKTIHVGFWKSKQEPDLPMPVAREKPWKGKAVFLKAFAKAESGAQVRMYRGFSTCRICGIRNGTSDHQIGHYVWPEGLRHYVEKHNVKPPQEFVDWIVARNGKVKKPVKTAAVTRKELDLMEKMLSSMLGVIHRLKEKS